MIGSGNRVVAVNDSLRRRMITGRMALCSLSLSCRINYLWCFHGKSFPVSLLVMLNISTSVSFIQALSSLLPDRVGENFRKPFFYGIRITDLLECNLRMAINRVRILVSNFQIDIMLAIEVFQATAVYDTFISLFNLSSETFSFLDIQRGGPL